ncbi:hypothetical protein LguiB_018606 [Lonicera macranthoides]
MSEEGVQNILSTSTNLVEKGAPLTEVDLPSFPNRSYDQAALGAVYQGASNSFLSQSALDDFVVDFAETTGPDWTASGNISHDFFDSSSFDLSSTHIIHADKNKSTIAHFIVMILLIETLMPNQALSVIGISPRRRTEQNAALAPKGISSLSNKYLSQGNQAVDNIVHSALSDLVQKLDELPKTKHAAAPRWNKLSHQERNDTQGKSCTGTEGI